MLLLFSLLSFFPSIICRAIYIHLESNHKICSLLKVYNISSLLSDDFFSFGYAQKPDLRPDWLLFVLCRIYVRMFIDSVWWDGTG